MDVPLTFVCVVFVSSWVSEEEKEEGEKQGNTLEDLTFVFVSFFRFFELGEKDVDRGSRAGAGP